MCEDDIIARSTFVGPWLLNPARMSAFGVMNSLNEAMAAAVVAPDAQPRALGGPDHDGRQLVAPEAVLGHRGRISSHVVDDDHTNRARGDRAAHLRAERAGAAVDDDQLAGGSGRDVRAGVAVCVEQVERRAGEWREVTYRGSDRCPAARGVRERLTDEVLIGAGANGDECCGPGGGCGCQG
jgi:hypothetical protein